MKWKVFETQRNVPWCKIWQFSEHLDRCLHMLGLFWTPINHQQNKSSYLLIVKEILLLTIQFMSFQFYKIYSYSTEQIDRVSTKSQWNQASCY